MQSPVNTANSHILKSETVNWLVNTPLVRNLENWNACDMSISKWEIISTGRLLHLSYPIPGSEIVVKSRSVKRNAKNALVLGRAFFPAATAPFPKSRTSYFRSARFTDVTTILSESLVQATTKRLTSTTWGLPPPCKQAPNYLLYI